jgi:hypothetical protein
VTGFTTPLEYFVRADFPHQMSYLRAALLYHDFFNSCNIVLVRRSFAAAN